MASSYRLTGLRRAASLLFSAAMAVVASMLAADVFLADGVHWLDFVRVGLLALSVSWLAFGAAIAVNGLLSVQWTEPAEAPAAGLAARTAVLVPVYNEDPVATYSRVAAMAQDVAATGKGDQFDFVILSDTRDDVIAAQEKQWLAWLRLEAAAFPSRIYYRRREANTGRKAGNIADFIRRSGALYDYLVILDADSLMSGDTMLKMVLRMEAEPRLGLLQTLPVIIHARSWFGRAIQFAASFYSPVFARGVATLQGAEGPFWGHNAIVRTRAFAQSCGLPALSGNPPFGGHILSHDYVEAALLARNGWLVRLDPDLGGSFEEGPENVIDFAKRDRRWCQGNLQHARLIAAPGLKPWSRFVFVQGIMAYAASPIWALFLIAALMSPLFIGEPNYFPEPSLPAVFPRVEYVQALTLLTGVAGILIGPKLMIYLRSTILRRNGAFGGDIAALGAVCVEIIWSSILAPLMLAFQSRSVIQVLLGADGGWPASNRDAGVVPLREAWEASWWIIVAGAVVLYFSARIAPDLYYWLLPVSLPMLAAPLLIWLSSMPMGKAGVPYSGLFSTLQNRRPAGIIVERDRIMDRWRGIAGQEPAVVPVTAGLTKEETNPVPSALAAEGRSIAVEPVVPEGRRTGSSS